MTGDDHPVLVLHGQMQDALPQIVEPRLEGAALTRWVVVAEFALPSGEMALVPLSSNASGGLLTTWDQYGLLVAALQQVLVGRT